ncbi:zinc fingers and homeoboxes protein 2 [Callorhinchus milii]|uniref:zinc fingers and homeoboxes protein 2 n=1 Tax=Callorhinchus milii TaxID=7868 RepID=UPI001C3FB2EF|nr:zinc fingers and homeoboxes protein 2 [Callorhinchus milii]
MASKRKSTTPCMVRARDVVEQDPDLEMDGNADEGSPYQDSSMLSNESWPADNGISAGDQAPENAALDNQQSKKLEGGYECKYCTFETQDLNEFTEHVDSAHPNVILNPFYVCAACTYTTKRYDTFTDHNGKYHPGETNFKLKLIKRNNQTILEQTIEEPISTDGNTDKAEAPPAGISISKTPIMKMIKNKVDSKRINVFPRVKDEYGTTHDCKLEVNSSGLIHSMNRGLVIPETVIKDGVPHVMPSIQPPPNISLIPKVMIPMHGSKYNAAMDVNKNLINSFNKFPYPTQAELSWLTSVSKHPEEQIKMWFSTQRLKHGISWTPEEVEEARKMMFNGTIQTPTITVVPAQVPTSTKSTQQVIQTGMSCQLVGQTGIVLTQVPNGSAVSCSPITLTVAGSTNQSQKRNLQTQHVTPNAKRSNVVQICQLTPRGNSVLLSSGGTDVSTSRKKTKAQMAELKASFAGSQFPEDDEVFRLMQVTKLTRAEIKKWFSDNRYRTQKGLVSHTVNEPHESPLASHSNRRSGWNAFSDFAPQKFKEKTTEQLKILEESFQYSSFPTDEEKDRLRIETKLTRREIDSWFSERRKLRDSLEGAMLEADKLHLLTQDLKRESIGDVKSEGQELADAAQVKSSHSGMSYPSKSGTPPPSKTQEQLHILKSAFVRTQWPTVEQYDSLAVQSGLPRNEIVRWFGDNRYAIKNGNLRWLDQYQRANTKGHNGQNKFNGSGVSERRGSRKGHKMAGGLGGVTQCTHSQAGKSVLFQYYFRHRQLREEDLDELVSKSNMSYEQVRDWFAEKQTEDAMDTSESNSRDDQFSDEDVEGEDEEWGEVENVSERDEYSVSEFTENWAYTSQEGSTEFNELDSESMSAENSNI